MYRVVEFRTHINELAANPDGGRSLLLNQPPTEQFWDELASPSLVPVMGGDRLPVHVFNKPQMQNPDSAPPLVVNLPAGGSTKFERGVHFLNVMATHFPDRPIIMIDLPGDGIAPPITYSESKLSRVATKRAQIVGTLLDTFEKESTDLFGFCLGSNMALDMAGKEALRGRVRKLITTAMLGLDTVPGAKVASACLQGKLTTNKEAHLSQSKALDGYDGSYYSRLDSDRTDDETQDGTAHGKGWRTTSKIIEHLRASTDKPSFNRLVTFTLLGLGVGLVRPGASEAIRNLDPSTHWHDITNGDDSSTNPAAHLRMVNERNLEVPNSSDLLVVSGAGHHLQVIRAVVAARELAQYI